MITLSTKADFYRGKSKKVQKYNIKSLIFKDAVESGIANLIMERGPCSYIRSAQYYSFESIDCAGCLET